MLEEINNIKENSLKNRPIIELDQKVANRIAAGEVIERPSAIVKELIENSIDASSSKIEVLISDGGKSFIQVKDNGWGIPKQDLPLSICRHATSKLIESDLSKIDTYGFRGEALPSIGASARLNIKTRLQESDDTWEIIVENGVVGKIKPSSSNPGTVVEVRDLFFATPARLKFLKSDRIEGRSILDIFKRMALANPKIDFSLRDISKTGKIKLIANYNYSSLNVKSIEESQKVIKEAYSQRVKQIVGEEIFKNLLSANFSSARLNISGYVSLPTFSRSNSSYQYFFVNGRPVWDKQLSGALRASFSDFIMRGRYPISIIFINCPSDFVDANVHPAKTEIRFEDFPFIKKTLISIIKSTIANANTRTSTAVSEKMMEAFKNTGHNQKLDSNSQKRLNPLGSRVKTNLINKNDLDSNKFLFSDISSKVFKQDTNDLLESKNGEENDSKSTIDFPLGSPVAHVHQNYIISQSSNGLVIIDQHAAHERIIYEQLKNEWKVSSVTSQALLIPEIVELGDVRTSLIIDYKDDLERLGLVIEPFGNKSICLRSLPAILGQVSGILLINDLADELLEQKDISVFEEKIEKVISRVACHGSVRSGRKLSAEEMSALLRKMEETPYSNQCNHGRPTFVELKLAEIEKLFQRI